MLRLITRLTKLQIPEEKTKSFWFYTITEFVFIILGILIALQINNWNDNRKEKLLEEKILKEFLVNLKENAENFEVDINYLQTFINSTQIVLDHIVNQKPYNDSLAYHFGHMYGTSIISNNNAAFESLKSIGIDLIRDDNIRSKLVSLFDDRYNYHAVIQETEIKFLQEQLYVSISEELDMIELYEKAIPLNYSELHKNNKFIQDLKMSIDMKGYMIRANRSVLTLTNDLIVEIKEYLK